MPDRQSSRRVFLAQSARGLGGFALASLLPTDLLAAHRHAQKSAEAGATFKFFTFDEAADVKAFAAQVIPTDDTPGANEANVVYFIDHVLTAYEPQVQTAFRAAIDALNNLVRQNFPSVLRFSTLNADQQFTIMQAFEKAPSKPRLDLLGNFFGLEASTFELMRDYAIAGFLCEPELGGNKNGVGWQVMGFDGMAAHEPPFGFYDAELLKKSEEPK